MGNPASPPALSAGEFAEAHRREEGPVVLVADPAGIRPLEPGVIEQPVDVAQLEPVGRLPEQPRPDALAPVPLGDTQVADVGPSCGPGEPLSLVERLHLDVPDHVRPEHGGQAAAVDPDRPAHRQPRERGAGRTRQVFHPGQVDDLGVPGVGEPGLLVERADVRPLLGHPVDAVDGQFPARVLAADAPGPELGQARGDQRTGRRCRVGPVGIARRVSWSRSLRRNGRT